MAGGRDTLDGDRESYSLLHLQPNLAQHLMFNKKLLSERLLNNPMWDRESRNRTRERALSLCQSFPNWFPLKRSSVRYHQVLCEEMSV